MIIERYRPCATAAIYERLQIQGRLLPDGLTYVDSWPNRSEGICFQLMETEHPALLGQWFDRWSDLVTFECFALD